MFLGSDWRTVQAALGFESAFSACGACITTISRLSHTSCSLKGIARPVFEQQDMTVRIPTRQYSARLLLLVDCSAGLVHKVRDRKESWKVGSRAFTVIALRNPITPLCLVDHVFLLSALVRERRNCPEVAPLRRMMKPLSSTEEIYRLFSFTQHRVDINL